ncbi:MAG TPA: hypothetical protein VLJ68_13450 [Chitinophagaceae bacterium]|nr:hypothetical protein [Chitinophagaceae bacterium]
MKYFITIISFLFNLIPSHSQYSLITCTTVGNSDNTVSIYAESRAQAPYTIKIEFSTLLGYSSNVTLYDNVAIVTVEYGRKEIIRLNKIPMMSNEFRYNYRFYPGTAFKKAPDSSFLYLLPSTVGNRLRCYKVSSIADKLGINTNTEYYGMGFIYKLYDTVCAARAGTVFEVIDTVTEGEKKTTFYKSGRNKIAIEHRDGSLINYTFLAPIQLLVSQGTEILPGQPIAVFNKESEKYYVSVSTFYLDQKKLLKDDGYTSYYYLPLHFYIGENDPGILQPGKQYDVFHPQAVIAAELSKKEKKKLGF